jgi:lipid A 3-O-deacylase
MRRLVAFLASAALPAAPASAQLVEEVRLGVMQHNICVLDCDNAGKEDGPGISGELVFASPDFLRVIWSPRPYVVASANLGGDTSFGGAGLQWNWKFADGWSFEPGLSDVIHDGELSVPFPQGDPRNDVVSRSKVFLGSRDLFRASFALNRDFSDKWGIQVMHEHLSHGQILGNGRNQGIDNVGVRVIYRLSE